MLTAYLSNTYNYTLHVLEGKSVGKAFCGIAKDKQQIEELFICYDSAEPRPRGCSGLGEPRPTLPSF